MTDSPEHAKPIRWAVGSYALVLVYLVALATFGPAERKHHFFDEGSGVDWMSGAMLATATLFAWTICRSAEREPGRARWFWPASAFGLAFLVLDERFEFHGTLDWMVLEPLFGRAPFGLRNWNDAVVVGYGVVGLVFVVSAIPVVLRYKAFRTLLAAGFAFFALHTAVDLLFPRTSSAQIVEESFKLLAVTSLMLAYGRALLDRIARTRRSRALGLAEFAAFLLAALLFTVLVHLPGERWQKLLTDEWGSPTAWLISICLACGGGLLIVSSPAEREGRYARRLLAPLLLAAAGCAAVVACEDNLHESPLPPSRLTEISDAFIPLFEASAVVQVGLLLLAAGLLAFALERFRRSLVRPVL